MCVVACVCVGVGERVLAHRYIYFGKTAVFAAAALFINIPIIAQSHSLLAF